MVAVLKAVTAETPLQAQLAVAPVKPVNTLVVLEMRAETTESRREEATESWVTVGVADHWDAAKPFTIAAVPLNEVTPEMVQVELNPGPWKTLVMAAQKPA